MGQYQQRQRSLAHEGYTVLATEVIADTGTQRHVAV
jgi:hypothetical protein